MEKFTVLIQGGTLLLMEKAAGLRSGIQVRREEGSVHVTVVFLLLHISCEIVDHINGPPLQ